MLFEFGYQRLDVVDSAFDVILVWLLRRFSSIYHQLVSVGIPAGFLGLYWFNADWFRGVKYNQV